MDKIILKGLRLFAYHGVYEEEKRTGQNFALDLMLEADLSAACESDRLDDTVSYADVIETVKSEFCETSFDLIERAAQSVADAVLTGYDKVRRVTVRVMKPEAPLNAELDYAAVEIVRERAER